MERKKPYSAQILLFPRSNVVPKVTNQVTDAGTITKDLHKGPTKKQSKIASETSSLLKLQWPVGCVISGTYRKDPEGLKLNFQELRDFGCKVLSPTNVSPVHEDDGFVYMQGEESELPEIIEMRHLNAIQQAHFVWLHAPDGYVGPTASLEVGFARASGVPVFCKNRVNDQILRAFIHGVRSTTEALAQLTSEFLVPPPAVQSFQSYYKRVAAQRGYDKEDAQNCLLLMTEEVGELARAIRRRKNLVRHGHADIANEALELADIFLYVVHMANILDLDLSRIVREKELINFKRFFDTKFNDL